VILQTFKAWDKVYKQIFDVHSIDYKNECAWLDKEGWDGGERSFKIIELLPISGIHDDHEMEEHGYTELKFGDVLQLQDFRCKLHYETGGWMLVSDHFEDGYEWVGDWLENDGQFTWIPDSKFIGNIFESPNLLREETQ
jgi:hypothetical protein